MIKWVLLSFVVKRFEQNKVKKVRNREKCKKTNIEIQKR